MLKKFICSLTVIIALSVVAIARDGEATLTGYVVDKACSAKVAKDSNPATASASQPKGCILAKACFDSGVGIYADGKFVQFDENGAKLAKAALEKSKKDKGVKFKVTGKVAGDKIAVEKLEEVE
jgi:hypothetical protein